MLDEWLTPTHRILGSIWRMVTSLGVLLIITAGLLFVGPQNTHWVAPPTVAWTQTDDADFRRLTRIPRTWTRAPAHRIEDLDTPGWIFWEIPDDVVAGTTPRAIEMSGPFSAELYWNSQFIGRKGEVQTFDGRERAGPIDSLIAIPAEVITPRDNRLLIRLVSSQAGYEPAAIVQSLSIQPYRPDARRSLRYYLPSLTLLGVIGALIFVYARFWQQRRDPRLLWLVGALCGLWLADLAEISRALVNYPYSWHQPRQALAMTGLFLSVLGLFGFILTRWVQTSARLTRIGIAAAVLGLGVQVVVWTGYDARTVFGLAWMLGLIMLGLLWAGRREPVCWLLLPMALIALAYMVMFPGDFLDRAVYVLATTVLALAVGLHRDVLSPPPVHKRPPERLLVQSGGVQVSVPIEDIACLKAAGNYTEVHRRDGRWHLDNRSLKTVLEHLPDTVVRIHRSHAVPLARIERVSTAQGSRYSAHLDTGTVLPVSRGLVGELRDRLRTSQIGSDTSWSGSASSRGKTSAR